MTTQLEPNVFQDGKRLVAPLEGAVFPARCVKTNASVDATDFVFEGDLLRSQLHVPKSAGHEAADAVARLLFGRGGSGIVELMTKRSVKFHIGLSDERQATARIRWRIGIALVIIGPILAVVLGSGAAAITEKMNGDASVPLAIAGGAFGMILMVTGIVLFGIATMSTLRVLRSDGKYIWLEGACPEFLHSLPESPEKWKPRGLFG